MLAILNKAAGSSSLGDDELRALFAQAGEPELTIWRPNEQKNLSQLAAEAAQSDVSLIVAGGGDGTISAVAGALADTGKTLGVLPLGTLNHFAKDLGIPLEPAEAVATILRGQTRAVDVGEVNGRIFINNSSIGLYPRIVARREQLQENFTGGRWAALAWATLGALRQFPFLHLRLEIDGRELRRRTAFLFVGNNEYELEGFHLGARRCLDAGHLGLYLTAQTGRAGFFRLGLRALVSRLRQARDFETFCLTAATIESRRSRLLVATDGEVTTMETPLQYRIRPRALQVKLPNEK